MKTRVITLPESGAEVTLRKLNVRGYKKVFGRAAERNDLETVDELLKVCVTAPKLHFDDTPVENGALDINELAVADYLFLVQETQEFSGIEQAMEEVRPTSETETAQ